MSQAGNTIDNADAVLAAWRETYGELFPHRDPAMMQHDDSTLALAVMLDRRLQAAAVKRVTVASLRTGILDRLARYNPKDAE